MNLNNSNKKEKNLIMEHKKLIEDGSYSMFKNNNLTFCSNSRNKTSKIRCKKRNGVSTIEFEESTAVLIHNELGLFKLENSSNENSKSSQSNLRYPWVSLFQ